MNTSNGKVRLNVLLKKKTADKLKQTKEDNGTPIGFQIDKAVLARGIPKN